MTVAAPVQADAKFLRLIFMTLVGLTLLTGLVAGVTAVRTLNAQPSLIST